MRAPRGMSLAAILALWMRASWAGRVVRLNHNHSSKATQLEDICIVTVNYDQGNVPMMPTKVPEKEPGYIINKCGGADLIVIATQELIKNMWSNFETYTNDARAVPGYTFVVSCGHAVSPGVLVLVKTEHRGLITAEACTPPITADDKSTTNTKGTEVGFIETANGRIAFASTHGARGGTIDALRQQQLKDATERLLSLEPAIVAWGGDFNPRTSGVGSDILRVATTHPEFKDQVTDNYQSWLKDYNPKAARRMLAALPDIFAQEGETLDGLLQSTTQGKIVQAPGHRQLCPSYPKKPSPGKVEKKVDEWSEQFLKAARFFNGGAFAWGGMGIGFDLDQPPHWKPNFACQPENGGVEYYPTSTELGGKAYSGSGNKAPSWPDRILISGNLACANVRKIPIPTDHDVLLTNCMLPKL